VTDAFPTADTEITHILVCRDPAASRAWYLDVLGAELSGSYGSSVVLRFAGAWLLLVIGGEPTSDKPTITFAAPAETDRVDHSFTIRVKDCQASYEVLRSRGAEFLTPPHDWGGEVRCFFRDPDGHLFEISERRG
jgi:catechol 2,3-dioxygenase-like lactoylglutathione lyase family enzyme